MIAPVSPCTRSSYKSFEGAREENSGAMAGVTVVRAPPVRGSATGTPEQAGSCRARTPAQKGHNPRCDRWIVPIVFTGASGVRFPYSSHGISMQTARSLDLDVLAPELWAFHSSALSLASVRRITALLLLVGRGRRAGKER